MSVLCKPRGRVCFYFVCVCVLVSSAPLFAQPYPPSPPHLSIDIICVRSDLLHRPCVQSGFPYVAVFLRKDPEWNQAAGESDGTTAAAAAGKGGGAPAAEEGREGVDEGPTAEKAVQQSFPEVITSLDEVHEVGTLAQVSCWRIEKGAMYV